MWAQMAEIAQKRERIAALSAPFLRKDWIAACKNDLHANAWQSANDPSPTIVASRPPIVRMSRTRETRLMTSRECACLQSFPDEFILPKNEAKAVKIIGNAVPPLLSEAIARVMRGISHGSYVATLSYSRNLQALWSRNQTVKKKHAPSVISLFAGCGGSSLGYSAAGYQELLAVELNRQAASSFKANFPGIPFYEGDIRELSVSELLRVANIKSGELELLDGSPPCQGFSMAGKRKMLDRCNQLYEEFVRLLKGVQPRGFVMENVSGMIKGKMKLVFADCMRALKGAGYRVSCRLLDAARFGVPQHRKRLIWIGVRNDLGIEPRHPKAQTRLISVREALSNDS